MRARVYTKTERAAPAGFFEAEARGLRWLAEVADGPRIPVVREVAADRLVIDYVDEAPPSPDAAELFGAALARMHAAGPLHFGFGTGGFIGPLPLDNTHGDSWPDWYAQRRVLPFVESAVDLGALTTAEAQAIETVCEALPDTGEPPARIHGDLWSGNVLWGADRSVWLVDAAAAHGGHRETDLAMLALFGAPYLERIVAAYDDAFPLAAGWRERVGLHQLHPLLVHACLFGGGYGARAAAVARASF